MKKSYHFKQRFTLSKAAERKCVWVFIFDLQNEKWVLVYKNHVYNGNE